MCVCERECKSYFGIYYPCVLVEVWLELINHKVKVIEFNLPTGSGECPESGIVVVAK